MNLSPFEEFDLSPELLKALEKKGYTRPTAIQLEAIPAAMEERDVLIMAQAMMKTEKLLSAIIQTRVVKLVKQL